MATTDDFLEQERKRKASRAAAKKAAAERARQVGESQAAARRKAIADAKKKNADKAKQFVAETEKRKAENKATQEYQAALNRVQAAAKQAADSSSPEDLDTYNQAKANYDTVKANYEQVTGKSAAAAPTVRRIGPRGGKTTVVAPKAGGGKTAKAGVVDAAALAQTRAEDKMGLPDKAGLFGGGAVTAPAAAGGTGTKPMPSEATISAFMRIHPDWSRERIIAALQASMPDTTPKTKPTTKGGSVSTQTQRSVTQYSAQQLQSAATDAAQQAIGRALTSGELKRLTAHINALEAQSPTITTQTTVSRKGGSSTSSRTRGGIDETQAMRSWAEANPEYASYQQATTYFDSMLSALRGPAGGSV